MLAVDRHKYKRGIKYNRKCFANKKLNVQCLSGRKADAQINFLDIKRFEDEFGKLIKTPLTGGIMETAKFLKKLK